MPIDHEPIQFKYNNINWRIWLWKGQYYASTGGEIGLYREVPGRPGMFDCAYDKDMIYMSFDCVADGKKLFHRNQKHWWLTGFLPGNFANPDNMALENISLKFNSKGMAQAFYKAIVSYFNNNKKEYKYSIDNDTVKFRWQKTIADQGNKSLRKDP